MARLKPPAGVEFPVAPVRRYQLPPPVAVLLISTAAPLPSWAGSEPVTCSRLAGDAVLTPTKPPLVMDMVVFMPWLTLPSMLAEKRMLLLKSPSSVAAMRAVGLYLEP